MDALVNHSQYVVIGLYAFNTLGYFAMKEYNKALYWFGAVCLAIAVFKMR